MRRAAAVLLAVMAVGCGLASVGVSEWASGACPCRPKQAQRAAEESSPSDASRLGAGTVQQVAFAGMTDVARAAAERAADTALGDGPTSGYCPFSYMGQMGSLHMHNCKNCNTADCLDTIIVSDTRKHTPGGDCGNTGCAGGCIDPIGAPGATGNGVDVRPDTSRRVAASAVSFLFDNGGHFPEAPGPGELRYRTNAEPIAKVPYRGKKGNNPQKAGKNYDGSDFVTLTGVPTFVPDGESYRWVVAELDEKDDEMIQDAATRKIYRVLTLKFVWKNAEGSPVSHERLRLAFEQEDEKPNKPLHADPALGAIQDDGGVKRLYRDGEKDDKMYYLHETAP
jgi:hypothetical protein